MALKGNWVDKVDGVDYVLSKDINDIAHSVIEAEEAIEDIKDGGGGSSGQDGVTFTPNVSSDGIISWTNDGGLQNPTPVNIKGTPGSDGTSVTIKSISESAESGGESVVTFSDGKTLTVKNGKDGKDGVNGIDGIDGEDYILTGADKAEIAELIDGATVVQAPKYVNSVDEMTDTSRVYVMASTGRIWAYMDSSTTKEVTITDQIVGTTDNPYEVGRLGSSGTLGEAISGYVITPYIDLTKEEYVGKTINLHLEGSRYVSETNETYIQMAIFKADKTVLNGRSATCMDKNYAILPVLENVSVEIQGTTSATLAITIPPSYNGTTIGYWRFCGKGTEEESNVYITYEDTQIVQGGQWVDTGTSYSPALTEAEMTAIAEEAAALIDTQLLSVIGSGEVSV